jgi:hypothetical protein
VAPRAALINNVKVGAQTLDRTSTISIHSAQDSLARDQSGLFCCYYCLRPAAACI